MPWPSSSSSNRMMTEREERIYRFLAQHPGEHTATDISVRLEVRIDGKDIASVQVKAMEDGRAKVRRRRDGRFVYWQVEQKG